jgi:hypothetical protein
MPLIDVLRKTRVKGSASWRKDHDLKACPRREAADSRENRIGSSVNNMSTNVRRSALTLSSRANMSASAQLRRGTRVIANPRNSMRSIPKRPMSVYRQNNQRYALT